VEIWERLRQAREQQGLELRDLEDRTRVRHWMLCAIETGRFGELPGGLYARAVVRSYAEAVGLDPVTVLADVSALLPGVTDPLDALARVHGCEREVPNAEPRRVQSIGETTARIAVTVVDSTILAFIDLCVIGSSAWLCDVSIDVLLQFAAPAIVMLSVLIAGLYFLMFGGVTGVTPGMRAVGVAPVDGDSRHVSFMAAVTRTCHFVLCEGSILVELFVAVRRSAKTIDPKPAALEGEGQIEGSIGDEVIEIVRRPERPSALGVQRAEIPGR